MSDKEKKAKDRAYAQRPEVKFRRRLAEQRPEIKAIRKAYKQTFKYKKQQKEYRSKPKVRARLLEYLKKYDSKPENKLKKKVYAYNYNQRDDVKARIKLYRQQPEVKAKIKEYTRKYDQENKEIKKVKRQEYNQIPEVKAKIRAQQNEYSQTPERKARRKEIRGLSENKLKRKLYWERYSKQPETIAKIKAYTVSYKVEKVVYDKKRSQLPEVKDRLNKSRIQRKKDDSGYNVLCNLRSGFNKAFQHYSKKGKRRLSKKYGVNHKAIIEHLGEKPDDRWIYEDDHIIPLSMFDHNDPRQVQLAWAPENHQWLTKEINRWKGNRLIKPLTDEEKIKLQAELTKSN